jgi:tetratricopeptide (TPR) repeat protein
MKKLIAATLGCAFMFHAAVADEPEVAAQSADIASVRKEIAGYAKLARQAAQRGDLAVAETFYQKLLSLDAPAVEKKDALFEMARGYEAKHASAKAIAVYEKLHELFPTDPQMPELLIELGLLYRGTGAYQLAISRFYAVLNSVLKINEREFVRYHELASRAQFEIAETYLLAGDYAQARKFFSLMDRLDLSRDDKAHMAFNAAYCRFLTGDLAGTISDCRNFLETYGDTKHAPECRHVLASALKKSNRSKEALDEVLALLRAEKALKSNAPKEWTYWQQKTGNQLANEFYQHGEFASALTIYQALARLDDAPAWRWPVVYEMGLCFERLRLSDRAIEAYRFILDEHKKLTAAGKPAEGDLATLLQSARWRSDELAWQQTATLQLDSLLGASDPAPENEPLPGNTPARKP